MVKRRDHAVANTGQLYLRDFWGRALNKRQALVDALSMDAKTPEWRAAQAATSEGPRAYVEITPTKASWFRYASGASGEGYEEWPSIKEIFAESFQGVNPNRGISGSLIDVDRQHLASSMKLYFGDGDDETGVLPMLMKCKSWISRGFGGSLRLDRARKLPRGLLREPPGIEVPGNSRVA